MHSQGNGWPFISQERFALTLAQCLDGPCRDKHADSPLDRYKTFILKLLICFGDRQRIRPLFSRKGPHGRQHGTFRITPFKNADADFITQAKIDRAARTVHR